MRAALVGDRAAVEAFLATSAGTRFAIAMAREVFEDEDALCAFELGDERYPAPVEAELDKLIRARNARD